MTVAAAKCLVLTRLQLRSSWLSFSESCAIGLLVPEVALAMNADAHKRLHAHGKFAVYTMPESSMSQLTQLTHPSGQGKL